VTDREDGVVPGRAAADVPAAVIAARRVADVRDDPRARLELLRASYAPIVGAAPVHLRYRRAALAFMSWQVRRGLLNPPDDERPGSPWWRAVNERLLRDTQEARLRVLGHPGPSSLPSAEPSVAFAFAPSSRTWYRAHNISIVSAYIDHRDLAEAENRVERFFINLVLVRLLYAHALVAEPRLALDWLAPAAPALGDPRRAMTGLFLSISRVLPDVYPLDGELDDYIDDEHTIGRMLDLGVIMPRVDGLYRWAADEQAIPALNDLVSESTPCYAWDPGDEAPWTPSPTRLVRLVRRAIPAPPRHR
jgi:hypothetical protein